MDSIRTYKWKKSLLSIILLFFIILQFNWLIYIAVAEKKQISGFWTEDVVQPNEKDSYHFQNNNIFEISTDILIDLYIEYENTISNRQTSFVINNSNPITLNIATKSRLQNFGTNQSPQQPKKGRNRLQFRYNSIFRIRSNTSIEKITIKYQKVLSYGINPDISYSLAILESGQESWVLIDTKEKTNETSSEQFLESSLLSINGDTDYFITLFEIEGAPYDWSWLIITIIVVSIGIISLIVLISKRDYFKYLKTRTISIERGAHRLSLDDVLENENRNKIIDLILTKPGIHFNELLRQSGIAAGNLVWHLDILSTYKVIGKKRIGNFVAYIPYYQKNPISNIDLKLQKSKVTLEILEMIEQEPGLWNNLITKKLKVDHKTVQYHIKKLTELGLINIIKEGRKNKLLPNLESDYFKHKFNNGEE